MRTAYTINALPLDLYAPKQRKRLTPGTFLIPLALGGIAYLSMPKSTPVLPAETSRSQPVAAQNLDDLLPETTSAEDDVLLLAQVLYGEARGESDDFKRDVAYSVLNRTGKNKWWGNTFREVILKPDQYTCFNTDDANYDDVQNPVGEAWEDCKAVARDVLLNPAADTTNGATHFYTTWIDEPHWAHGETPVKVVQTGMYETNFYKLEK